MPDVLKKWLCKSLRGIGITAVISVIFLSGGIYKDFSENTEARKKKIPTIEMSLNTIGNSIAPIPKMADDIVSIKQEISKLSGIMSVDRRADMEDRILPGDLLGWNTCPDIEKGRLIAEAMDRKAKKN